MAVALHGNLKDFGIAEVFQLIGQQRKTGLLEIKGEGQKVQLAFDAGSVVWASPVGRTEFSVLGDRLVRCGLVTRAKLDELVREGESSARPLPSLLVSSGIVAPEDLDQISDLLSRETIFEVMRWSGGSFHFSAQSIHHDVPPEKLLAAEQILMDGLRMLDEWQTFAANVPSDQTIFRRVGGLEEVRSACPDRVDRAEQIFQLVDGRLDARRIIDLSRLGTFDATRVLAELHQAGLIEPLAARAARRIARTMRPPRPLGDRVRGIVAAVLPLVLLAGVVLIGLRERPLKRELAGTAIVHRPLARAEESFGLRRLQNAVELERYLHGDWPADLDAVERRYALTPASAHPYYYARRGEGIILLPPKR